MACGYDEDDFWRKTPRQVGWALRASEKRRRREYNERVQLAWHTASLVRTDKPPSSVDKLYVSEDVLPAAAEAKPPRKRQSLQEMKMAAFFLTVANGGKVNPKALN